MNFLAAVGAFIVSFILLNIIVAAGTATFLAAIIAVLVFLGYPRGTAGV